MTCDRARGTNSPIGPPPGLPPVLPRSARVGTAGVGLLVARSLTAEGCGRSDTPAVTVLNTETIEQSSWARRGKRPDVNCPAGVHQTKGPVFTCTAILTCDSTRFVVAQTDGAGHVHYEAR